MGGVEARRVLVSSAQTVLGKMRIVLYSTLQLKYEDWHREFKIFHLEYGSSQFKMYTITTIKIETKPQLRVSDTGWLQICATRKCSRHRSRQFNKRKQR